MLEHQLRIDGTNRSSSLTLSIRERSPRSSVWLVELSDPMMVLDPTKNDGKWKHKGCKWQRAGKPPLSLAATEHNGGNARCTESAAKPSNDPYGDEYDFM
ncbi:hypothetical protein [Bradyrhizobium cajani]|uniref:hypothetical protein n=1 Tax=Bradyrhizobium cajani TaxID=1928661 RepID=UPI001FEA3A1D|nr:hypothetical protein [Bradyrhizobium cajani]MCP3367629.1 hypothetical protein [Bradyrhizobium cajani]